MDLNVLICAVKTFREGQTFESLEMIDTYWSDHEITNNNMLAFVSTPAPNPESTGSRWVARASSSTSTDSDGK